MPPPTTIQHPKQLLVEGKTPELFFQSVLRALTMTDIQVQNYGGISDLAGFLKALRNQADFTTITRVGIARDGSQFSVGAAKCKLGVGPRRAGATEPTARGPNGAARCDGLSVSRLRKRRDVGGSLLASSCE
jgi:hypothetical protein